MLRTLDGQVRARLSDRYRRLDNYDLAVHVLPILKGLPELRFESVEPTETRMYIKCVTPQLKFEMAPGDIVQAGIAISNSEVGQGTLVCAAAALPPVPQRPHRRRPRPAQDASSAVRSHRTKKA